MHDQSATGSAQTSGPADPRFRPTVWPGGVTTVPAVPMFHLELTAGVVRARATAERVSIPDELYLRGLLDLDLSSSDLLLDFMRTYGVVLGLDLHGIAGLYVPDEVRVQAQRANLGEGWDIRVSAWTLRYLKALVLHWIAAQQGSNILDAWSKVGLTLANERVAWYGWANLLTGFVSPFQLRVQLFEDDKEPAPVWVTLDQALGLQLANAIAEGGVVRCCARETCGNYYVRQVGRAQYAHLAPSSRHTTGTRYCSARCAKAQSERERRRRKRATA
jgi:hypothetical protein